ncbi:MAG: hypothetical protein JWO37_1483 [Acidimicrobiales bacterium]|nr:hypothetical protein [Acidimicrobiales bacterium]
MASALAPVAMQSASGLAPQGSAWRGPLGVTESTAAIMARQQSSGARVASRPVRRENENDTRGPDRSSLSQAPGSRARSASPGTAPAAQATAPSTPQTVPLTFTGGTLGDTGAYPPDSMGAVGPTQFLVGINGLIRSFTKAGTADGVLNVDSDVFFASKLPVGSFTSDPRVRYDRTTDRWFITMISATGNPTEPPNKILLAVSDTGVLTGATTWTFWSFQHDLVGTTPNSDTGAFADYDTLGIDSNALYLGVNMFSSAGAFMNTTAFVIQKASVLGAGPIIVTPFRGLIDNGGNGPFAPQGADNLYGATSDKGYLVGIDNLVYGKLDVVRIANPGSVSPAPTIDATTAVTTDTTAGPTAGGVPQVGTTKKLDALDDRLFMASVRNGHLWAAQNIGTNNAGVASSSPTRTSTRWYDLQNLTTTPIVYQSGTVYDSSATARSYWMPSVAVSGQGHAAIGGSTSSPSNHADAFTVGRLSGDALGTTGTPNIYTTSTSVYGPQNVPTQRWGDYSFTSVDPTDDMTMWTINEYANGLNTYAVQVAKLLAPPPATPTSVSPATVPIGQASVSVTLTGTAVGGSGFFDPGVGFTKHINATIPGVAVNSVTYVDPTHVTLNLNTTTSNIGMSDVTITNPDGQALTGQALLGLTDSTKATFLGRVTDDTNANGVRDPGEPAISGQTVFLDTDNSGTPTGAEPSTTTAANGSYALAVSGTGTDRVRTQLPAGWVLSSPQPADVGYGVGTVSVSDFNEHASPSTTTLSAAPNPSTSGQAVTFTATVTCSAGPVPGTVTFFDGATSIGAGALSGTNPGTATLTTSALANGSHSVTASYAPNGSCAGSVSAAVVQQVTPPSGGGGGGGGGPPTPDPVTRLFGSDRVATAIAISNNSYPAADSAGAVVLARSDGFADALAGTPFAAARTAPLLLTPSHAAIDGRVSAEISRVLSPGKPVFILGGPGAVDPSVDSALAASGYQVVRYQGADRYATAVAVAHDGLNDPPTALLATGTDFADALAGGAAAANVPGGAAVLLTNGSTMPPATATYLSAHPPVATYALGGPAAAAAPSAQAIVGGDRFETSVKVAQRFFTGPVSAAVAYAFNFPDALAGGAHIATRHSPLLLVDSGAVPGTVDNYLVANKLTINSGYVYGGTAVISDATLQAFQAAIT